MNLLEATIGDLLRKQGSITSLFPSFNDRVRKVNDINLSETTPFIWKFTVASASKPGHRYDVYVRWKNVAEVLKEKVLNMKLWKKDDSDIDIRLLAPEVMNDTDVELFCSCPADIYYGGQYIRTQKHAKYTEPETRPPVKKNPKQYGAFCKHTQKVFNQLPFYITRFGSWLKKNYNEDIEELAKQAKKRTGAFKKEAEFLRKKEEEEAVRKELAKKKEKENVGKAAEFLRKQAQEKEASKKEEPKKEDLKKEEPKPKKEEPPKEEKK